MKRLSLILVILIAALQYPLWFGKGSWLRVYDIDRKVKAQDAQTLLTCPMHTPVTVTRVIDQDKTFLRFIEGHHLKPGESIEVEHRDTTSDSVRVRGKDDQRITIGTRAASKLLVQVARVLLLVLIGGGIT